MNFRKNNDSEMMDNMNEASRNIGDSLGKVDSAIDRADKAARNFTKGIKDDYNASLNSTMSSKSKFGFKMYMYALILFGFFMVENSTCITLLIAWVTLVEKNRELSRLCISTLAMYVAMIVFFDITYDALYLLGDIVAGVKLHVVAGWIGDIRSFILHSRDFVFAFVGATGMLKAKRGNYYKFKFIEEMFEG